MPLVAVVLATFVAAAACGATAVGEPEIDGRSGPARATSTTVPAGAAPATGADPPPSDTVPTIVEPIRIPTRADPLRILLVGDSVAYEVSAPMDYALEVIGSAVVDVASLPSVPSPSRDVARHEAWLRALSQYRPEVVVVLMGYWEAALLGAGSPEALPPPDEYARDVLAPFVAEASQNGAEVVWIGPPLVRDPAQAAVFAELSRRFAAFAEQGTAVTFVDGNAPVAGPDGRFTDVLEGPRGPERVRVSDGLHLCPDGAARIAAVVMAVLQDRWNLPSVGSDWPQGAWRRRGFTAAADCPPP